MDFVKNPGRMFYPVLSMFMKKEALPVWMCIFMWTVFQRPTALQTFHKLRMKNGGTWHGIGLSNINRDYFPDLLMKGCNYGNVESVAWLPQT